MPSLRLFVGLVSDGDKRGAAAIIVSGVFDSGKPNNAALQHEWEMWTIAPDQLDPSPTLNRIRAEQLQSSRTFGTRLEELPDWGPATAEWSANRKYS